MTSKAKTKAGVKARIAANGYRLCDPLPKGETLIDSTNKEWILGSSIGSGGFGDIYSCRRKSDRQDNHVIKLDNKDGPLYAEVNFYLRVAKEDSINEFISKHSLKFLGVPYYVANGIHDKTSRETNKVNRETKFQSQHKSNKNGPTLQYRFLVMQRFGQELSHFVQTKRLTTGQAAGVCAKMIDAIHYIHTFGYIHADIKGTNILKSLTNRAAADDFYLVDFGNVDRYVDSNGKHRDEKPDKKRANNGTVEYRSRDAHIGLISRRSDIECLMYNLIEWLYGRLPWLSCLSDADKVEASKEEAVKNVDKFLKQCFNKKSVPKGLKEFIQEVTRIRYDAEPNYTQLKKILVEKVAKSKSSASVSSGNGDNSDNEDENNGQTDDDQSDNDDDNGRTAAKRRRKPTKNSRTTDNSKSPQKRKQNSTNNKKSKSKDISIVDLSDSDNNTEEESTLVSKSPPKRSRMANKNQTNSYLQPVRTPIGRFQPRFSTPLLFASDDNSSSYCESSDFQTPETTDRVLRGGRVKRHTISSPSDLDLSRDNSPVINNVRKAPPIKPMTTTCANSPPTGETPAMRAIREQMEKKRLEKEMAKKKSKKTNSK